MLESCQAGEWKCGDRCISPDKLCNSVEDCTDASDEGLSAGCCKYL